MTKGFSLWLKIPYTLFVAVLVVTYWHQYGPQNFLWGCDIALFCGVLALWKEWSLPASMGILVTLIPDIIWNLDLLSRLFGVDMLGVNATAYMLNPITPLFVRLLSLFHLFLVPVLLWVIYRLGYDSRALLWQTVLTAIILPLSYVVSDPLRNINWVHGFGSLALPWSSGAVHLLLLMVLVVMLFYIPTHILMKYYFSGRRTAK
jgi:hypothetical protein